MLGGPHARDWTWLLQAKYVLQAFESSYSNFPISFFFLSFFFPPPFSSFLLLLSPFPSLSLPFSSSTLHSFHPSFCFSFHTFSHSLATSYFIYLIFSATICGGWNWDGSAECKTCALISILFSKTISPTFVHWIRLGLFRPSQVEL